MLFEHRDTEDRGRSLVCGATPIKPGDVVLTEAPTAYVEMSDNDAVVRKNTFTFASVFAFLRFQKMEPYCKLPTIQRKKARTQACVLTDGQNETALASRAPITKAIVTFKKNKKTPGRSVHGCLLRLCF